MLWKEVMRHMYKLWALADADLLDNPNAYQLWNTGQGLNRVQACPLVAAEMRRLLHKGAGFLGGALRALSFTRDDARAGGGGARAAREDRRDPPRE